MTPKFVYESYSIEGNTLKFNYSACLPAGRPLQRFTHTVTFENLTGQIDPNLVFQLGLAEMFSYWKLFCSPVIEVRAGRLAMSEVEWWHKLAINGMGQYFYENQIDFTKPDFLKIVASGPQLTSHPSQPTTNSVLLPLGGGKDSIVTYELLQPHFDVRPIIVYPTTPASARIANNPIVVRRVLDPHMLELTKQGLLTGHIPYSAVLAFIFLIPQYKYIAVSNERSSEEGNVEYLGHTINHQYSKTLEFETDFNNYIKNTGVSYFSFIRPLYELQIAKLFSKMPQYFDKFRSCNKNQQQDSWCGHCPKCVSTALLLKPFISKDEITKIIGSYPSESEMKQLTVSKPFECVLTKAEAQAALTGENLNTILTSWQNNPNMPPEFAKILKAAL